MSYRVVVSADFGDDDVYDAILRSSDMGDVMMVKDMVIATLQSCVKYKDEAFRENFIRDYKWMTIFGIPIEFDTWNVASERAEWIKTYAEREYVVNMATGQVTSPEWSLKLDQP